MPLSIQYSFSHHEDRNRRLLRCDPRDSAEHVAVNFRQYLSLGIRAPVSGAHCSDIPRYRNRRQGRRSHRYDLGQALLGPGWFRRHGGGDGPEDRGVEFFVVDVRAGPGLVLARRAQELAWDSDGDGLGHARGDVVRTVDCLDVQLPR